MSTTQRIVLAFSFLFVHGCGNSSSSGKDLSASTDDLAGTAKDLAPSGPDMKTPAGACNSLQTSGAAIVETHNFASIPTGTGGTIADGTYRLTDSVVYGSGTPSSMMIKRILQKTGNTVQEVVKIDTGADVTTTSTVTIATPNLTRVVTCPVTDAGTGGGKFSYTADANGFTLYDAVASKSFVYTKQ